MQNQPFIKVELEIMKFSLTEIYIYYIIASHRNNKTQEAFPSQKRIAEEAECSVTTVKKAIAKFKKAEILEVNVKPGFNNIDSHPTKWNVYNFFGDRDYRQISPKLKNESLTAKQKGMLIILMLNCYIDKPKCDYSRKELYEKCKYSNEEMGKWGISHNTFDKYFQELAELGYVKSNPKGYSLLREDLYIIPKELKNTIEQFYQED